MGTRIKLNLNTQALAKTASVISNSVLLTANAYLIGSNFLSGFRERKYQHIKENLQLTAEISAAMASLTRVITDTIGKHHAGG